MRILVRALAMLACGVALCAWSAGASQLDGHVEGTLYLGESPTNWFAGPGDVVPLAANVKAAATPEFVTHDAFAETSTIGGMVVDLEANALTVAFINDGDAAKSLPADINLALEKLGGWQPTVDLKTGLTQTIGYFDSLLKKQSLQELVQMD